MQKLDQNIFNSLPDEAKQRIAYLEKVNEIVDSITGDNKTYHTPLELVIHLSSSSINYLSTEELDAEYKKKFEFIINNLIWGIGRLEEIKKEN